MQINTKPMFQITCQVVPASRPARNHCDPWINIQWIR
jgi:hypothetical protein